MKDAPWTRAHLFGALWALLCVAVLASGGPIWDHVALHGELHGNYVGRYQGAAIAAAAGRLPLWNPYEFAGVPLLASPHGAMLYPPVILSHLLLSPFAALQALYLGHAALLAWSATVYLARIGLPPALGGLAALVALGATLSGIAFVGVDHPPFVMCLAWIPVQLLSWRHAIRPGGHRWLVLLAVAVAAEWLAGYPQFLPVTGIALLLVAAIDDGTPAGGIAPSLARRIGMLVIGFGLGTALALPQILPLLELANQTGRPDTLAKILMQRTSFRIDSVERLLMLTPIKPGLLAAVALAAIAVREPDRPRVAWLSVTLWSLLALWFPFSLLYRLPPLNMVRFPFELNPIAGLFLAFLSVAGLRTLLASPRRWVVATGAVAGLVAGVQAAHLVHRAPTAMSGPAPDYAEIAKRMTLVRERRRDLSPHARFVGGPEIRGQGAFLHELPSPLGFESALRLRRIDQLLRALELGHHASIGWKVTLWRGIAANPDLAALLGIGFVLAPPRAVATLQEAGFESVGRVPGGGLHADALMFRPPVPRARLVHRVFRAGSEDESLQRVTERPAASRSEAVVEGGAPLELAEPPQSAREWARIVVAEPERLVVKVHAAASALLVVTDTYYPGWTATVDGSPAVIHRADYAFRGVVVPMGIHEVEFAYRPASVRWGLAGGALSGLVLSFLLLPLRARGAR